MDKASKNWDSEILKALAHPIRRCIIECLREKNALSFNELTELVNIGNHGRLGFHLRALRGLVGRKGSPSKYCLTDRGQLASELAWDVQFIISRGGRDLAHEPTRYVRRLALQDHALLLYSSEDAKREISYSFLEAGLPKKEALIYFVPEGKLDLENREIQRHGIGSDYYRNGAFTIMSAEEWYLRRGGAQAKTIIANALALANEKQRAGFKGTRFVGEMSVFFDNARSEELLEYEAKLGRQLPANICGLCLYDTDQVSEKQVNELLRYHGHIITRDIAWKTV